jgi:hypothetical protein
MLDKIAKLNQIPKFNLFEFEEKLKHPYFLMMTSIDVANDCLTQLVKDVGDWKIDNSTVTHEIDVIHAKYITGVAGADAATVAALQAMKKRASTANNASLEVSMAFMTATMLWSVTAKKEIREKIEIEMKTKRAEDYIENPEVDIKRDSKKLVTEIKKLNKELRDVRRGKETIKDCYAKQQTLNLLEHSRRNTALDILMK